MKYFAIIFIMTVLPAYAQNAVAQYRTCGGKSSTQMELNICASKEAASADVQLNKIYAKLLSQAADQSDAVVKIKFLEKTWVIYRDAYIDAMYPAEDKQAEYGSMYPMEVDLLRAKLVQRQILALRELLQQFGGE